MFNNSGSKLKVIAKVLFILLVLGSIAFGVVNFTGEEPKVLVGILSIVGGFFLAWFICLCLTALGEAAMAAGEREEADTVLSRRLNSIDHKLDLVLDEQVLAKNRQERLKLPEKTWVPEEERERLKEKAEKDKGKKKDKDKGKEKKK